jgi:ADP-heptose:LPS heptosyltransferase
MHFAAAQGVPVIGLFRNGIHRLWAPPVANVRVIEPGPHHPVAEIAVETVLDTLQEFQISLV